MFNVPFENKNHQRVRFFTPSPFIFLVVLEIMCPIYHSPTESEEKKKNMHSPKNFQLVCYLSAIMLHYQDLKKRGNQMSGTSQSLQFS